MINDQETAYEVMDGEIGQQIDSRGDTAHRSLPAGQPQQVAPSQQFGCHIELISLKRRGKRRIGMRREVIAQQLHIVDRAQQIRGSGSRQPQTELQLLKQAERTERQRVEQCRTTLCRIEPAARIVAGMKENRHRLIGRISVKWKIRVFRVGPTVRPLPIGRACSSRMNRLGCQC